MTKKERFKNLHIKDKEIIDKVNTILEDYKFKSGHIDKDNV